MRTVPIVFAFDDRMVLAAGVCLTSLLTNADANTFYDIFILHHANCDFTNSALMRLPDAFKNCRITCIQIHNEFENSFEIRNVTEATYYRLLSPDYISQYDKFLYSDVDVIFREDLSKYLDIELGDSLFAGVNSVPVMNNDYLSYIQSIGINPAIGYFYAGNLVINAVLLRSENKLVEFKKYQDRKLRFQDMDIINLTCKGRIKQLDPAFCLTTNYYAAFCTKKESMLQLYSQDQIDHALHSGIVHYNGAKPWNEVCANMDIWWDYYRKSIFYDEQFTHDFWYKETYRMERLSLWKRIKLVGRYFKEGGRK